MSDTVLGLGIVALVVTAAAYLSSLRRQQRDEAVQREFTRWWQRHRQ